MREGDEMAKLYFRYGAMNCGKTTILQQVAYNYEERGMHVLLVKPAIDSKGNDNVVSRLGIERKVDYVLKESDSIIKLLPLQEVDVLIVDEAQFLTKEQVDELYYITKTTSIPVLCYGLRCDFQMNPFPGSARLLQIADSIEEIKTICECGKKATQNIRIVNGIPTFTGSQVVIDGACNEVNYQSVCGECYVKIRKKELMNLDRREKNETI